MDWYVSDNKIWPRSYKTFFMLNTVEHEILDDHKYKNIKKFGFVQAQISIEYYFFPLIIVKMLTNVQENVHAQLS